MKIIIYLFCFIFCLNVDAQKLKVAVLDPTTSGIGIDTGTKLAVQELISSAVVSTGKYSVVERSMIESILKEQSFSNSDFVDNTQATEIGRLSGANKVFVSAISLVGERNMLSVKLIDVKTATIEGQQTKIVQSSEMLDLVESLIVTLLNKIEDEMSSQVVNPQSKDGQVLQTNKPLVSEVNHLNERKTESNKDEVPIEVPSVRESAKIVKETSVNEMTTSTVLNDNSYLVRGLRQAIDLSSSLYVGEGICLDLTYKLSGQVGSLFSIGGGLGMHLFDFDSFCASVFADSQWDFINSSNSPYLNARFGLSYNGDIGPYIRAIGGMRFKKISVFAGFQAQGITTMNYWGDYYEEVSSVGFGPVFGISFDWGARRDK